MIEEYLLLAVLLVGWCSLHSATIAGPIAARVQVRLGGAARCYRLLYNAVAVATFIPVVAYAWAVRTASITVRGAISLRFRAVDKSECHKKASSSHMASCHWPKAGRR